MSMREKLEVLGKEAVLGKIREAGLREYGTLNEDLYGKIGRITGSHEEMDGPMLAAGALNNNDFSGMLLDIVKSDPGKVLQGLDTVAWLVNAEKILLYLPEQETELARCIGEMAGRLGMEVEVVNDIVNARLMRDGITCHVETLAAVADVLDGTYKPQTLVSVVKYETSAGAAEVKAPAYVPFGTKLTDVTGPLDGVKAVGVGAALYAPEKAADVVISAELALGDGVIKLYGDGCCMVDVTEKGLLASRRKSCGKCTFCREGLLQLDTRMKEITAGKGSLASLDIMKDIGEVMTFSGSCTLGDFGSCMTLETMKQFADEYQDHIARKKCTAGTCLAFVNMYIDPAKCTGCGKCIAACPDDLIEGLPGYIHMIEDIDCTKCGKCQDACPEGAIVRTLGTVPRLPDRLTRVGRFRRY